MTRPTPKPPRLGERLLAAILPEGKLRDSTLGDLEEDFAGVAANQPRLVAWLWYWIQVTGFAVTFVFYRRRRAESGATPRGARRARPVPRTDFRVAARRIRKSWGVTLLQLATVAVAVATSTTLAEIARSILVDPTGYRDAKELMMITSVSGGVPRLASPLPVYMDLRRETTVFEEIGSLWGWTAAYTDEQGVAQRIKTANASRSLFNVLGVTPAIGRFFDSDDQGVDVPREVVLSHAFWRRALGADTARIGSAIELSGDRYIIVGVLPSDFRFRAPRLALNAPPYDVWLPLRHNYEAARDNNSRVVIGRTAGAIPPERLRTEEAEFSSRMQARHAVHARNEYAVRYVPLEEALVGAMRGPLLLLLLSAAIIVIAGAANVANLTASQMYRRETELAVRSSLGASPGQLLALVVLEPAVLAVASVVLGVGLAWRAVVLARDFLPQTVPNLDRLAMNPTTVAATSGVVVLAMVLGTAVAAGKVLRSRSRGMPRGGTVVGPAGGPAHNTRIAAQVAIALSALFAAGLLLQTLRHLRSVDAGYTTAGILAFDVSLPSAVYDTDDEVAMFFRRLEQRIRGIPGVEAVGALVSRPLDGGGATVRLYTDESTTAWIPLDFEVATPGVLETFGFELVAGRWVGDGDRGADPQRVVIDDVTARSLWDSGDVVGRRISLTTVTRMRPFTFERAEATVAGVIRRPRWRSLREREVGQFFVAHAVLPFDWMSMFVRSDRGRDLLPEVRAVVAELDPNVPLSDVRMMEDIVGDNVRVPQLASILLLTAAITTVFLAVVGVHTAVRETVDRRARELGVRVALGAHRQDVMWLVLVQGLRPVAAGVAVGVAGALVTGRVMAAHLFGVGPASPLVLLAGVSILIGAAALGCVDPAFAAARTDPTRIIKTE